VSPLYCARCVALAFTVFALGCGSKGPTKIAIADLKSDRSLEGKRLTVTGGQVDRVHKEFVKVIDPGRDPHRVDLLCNYTEANRATLDKAVRGQGITVTGKVIGPFDLWALPTLKLDECEFVLGDPSDGEAVPATKGHGEVEAERDLKAGKMRLRFKHRGGEPSWFKGYSKLLNDRCGVETVLMPDGGPIAGLHPDDREYNEVMTAAVEKKHGVGVLERLKAEAQKDR
jgi:hypothetical protein